jgi:hypothetical protein
VTEIVLDQVPPIYPVKVPITFDSRASADRENQKRISALAAEIASGNDNSIVIADGVRGVDQAITFQGMKGLNQFSEKDVSIILTCLAPEKFAELNVIGQWLGINDVIELHYDDQLNQAVGRNRGFRHSDRIETKTEVISTSRLWKLILEKRTGRFCRANLYIAKR